MLQQQLQQHTFQCGTNIKSKILLPMLLLLPPDLLLLLSWCTKKWVTITKRFFSFFAFNKQQQHQHWRRQQQRKSRLSACPSVCLSVGVCCKTKITEKINKGGVYEYLHFCCIRRQRRPGILYSHLDQIRKTKRDSVVQDGRISDTLQWGMGERDLLFHDFDTRNGQNFPWDQPVWDHYIRQFWYRGNQKPLWPRIKPCFGEETVGIQKAPI